ncbi:MAG: adenylate/guanylate cyclase domain-containing protein [Candidatus Dormibacteria bacterium]
MTAVRKAGHLPTGIVTLLLTDVQGSSRLWEEHRQNMPAAMTRHHEILFDAIDAHHGERPRDQGEGDSVLAAFARATDAVGCALELQRQLGAEPWPEGISIKVRMAVHTGEVELRGDDNYFGPAINRAARLRAIGHGGQVLLSAATAEVVHEGLPDGATLRDLGLHRLRDLGRPERVFQLCHEDLPVEFAPLKSLNTLPNNLPLQVTSFVGRERETAEVTRLVAANRLVTLTGAGGCGKTRLALQAAAELLVGDAGGVWFVDLAPLSDGALVPTAVATALRLQEEPGRMVIDTLVDHLRERRVLILLDNCEHMLPACADLTARLMPACADLHILATSREGLAVAGETTWRVPSMSLPDADQAQPLAEFSQCEAVSLFVERARSLDPAFALTAADAPAVAQICRRLDGIPLAIELAAALTDVLGCSQIAERLDDRFRLLTGGTRAGIERQQTLRAAVDWSFTLLTEEQKTLLVRLSVFAGGFTLEATEEVGAGQHIDPGQVLGLLSQLLRKSMAQMEKTDGVTRYRLLETIRQFARDKLLESGEADEVRTRHRDWYLALAEKAEAQIQAGGAQAEWLTVLEQESDNLRAAMEWSIADSDPSPGARLGVALCPYWQVRRKLGEGRRWMDQVLARKADLTSQLRGRALSVAGVLARTASDVESARPLLEESLISLRAVGDEQAIARSLMGLGSALNDSGNTAAARGVFEEGLAVSRKIGDRAREAAALNSLGICAMNENDHTLARAFYEESRTVMHEARNVIGVITTQVNLAFLAFDQGDIGRASELTASTLATAREVGARQAIAVGLMVAGYISLARGEVEVAAGWRQEQLSEARDAELPWMEMDARAGLQYPAADYTGASAYYEQAAAMADGLETQIVMLAWAANSAEGAGNTDRAGATADRALALTRGLGRWQPAIEMLNTLGRLTRISGDLGGASARHREALSMAAKLGSRLEIAASLEGLAAIAGEQGEGARAARLYGAAAAIREAIGAVVWPHVRVTHEQSLAASRAQVDADTWAAAWAEGEAMSQDEAVACALVGPAPT